MALHPQDMDAAIIRNLPAKTGKSLDEWLAALKAAPHFNRPKDAVDWLKREHGVGHISAQVIVRRSMNDSAPPTATALFADLERRSLFEALSAALVAAVPSTIITPCKTYVGFGNPRQYAVAQPLKSGGILVGLAAIDPALPFPEQAEKMGGSDRIKWKLPVRSTDDIAMVARHLTPQA